MLRHVESSLNLLVPLKVVSWRLSSPLRVLLMHPVKSTALAVLATVPLTSMLGSPLTLIALSQELPQRLPYASYVTLVVRIICLEPFEQVT